MRKSKRLTINKRQYNVTVSDKDPSSDCSPGHSMQDLKAQILWRVKGDIVDRKHLEAWLISRLNTVTPFGLNIKSH